MSWQACAWVDSLEHYLIGPLEFRVLLKLANVANETGTIAFRSKAEIANELGVHQKSVQKALRALEAAVLIKPGDQRLVQHIRADKRPTVYELNFRYKTQFEQPALPWPIDDQNPDKRGSLVIHRPERGSLPGSSGGASTVPHRTIKEQDLSKYQGDHNSEGSPAPTTALRADIDKRCPSYRRTHHHNFVPPEPLCLTCGRIDFSGNLYDDNTRMIAQAVSA